ncbi:neprilysin-1-like isoform X1 [Dermacentor variabilis]|uniref:neprilysin-1-like isoform X1 n=1 Tax=Dermacentor variabilis TaxID=34621 RepID=UPI003F5C5008
MGVEDTASSDRWRQSDKTQTHSTGLVLFCLFGMLPLLLTIAILGFFLFTQEPAHNIPTPATASKVPSITVGPLRWEQAAKNEFPCGTNECRSLSERLRLQVKFTADPCDDFYDYVCGRYWGDVNGALSEANAVMRSYTIASIGETTVPATGQKAWHKAAGLFKACVALASSHRSEVGDLTAWLATLGLDLNNLNPSIDPVDMIVRCSLDFGVEAVFAVRPSERSFIERKRSIEFTLSHAEELWHQYRHSLLTKSTQHGVDFYADTLAPYGVSAENATMVYKIMDLENELIISLNKHMSVGSLFVIGTIEDMGLTTTPLVTSAQWEEMFSKYTNGIYGGRDKIAYQRELLSVLAELLGLPATGPAGLRCLVAWSLFRQLLSYSQLPQDADDKETLYVCYQRVSDVMDLALNSHYLQSVVNYHAVYRALDMFARIREAFGAAIRNSSWLVGHERHVALRKLANMKALVGGPEHRWDEHYVEEYYEGLPDSPSDRFFEAWLKARSLCAHRRWSDQTKLVFDVATVNAYYERETNVVIVPAALLQPIFFFPDGNEAYNYGNLGDIMGHEIMHGYDILGVQYDDNNQFKPWDTPLSRERFVQNVMCLRGSHAQALRRKRHLALNDTVDSENLADFVGAATAYAAFRSLPSYQRHWTLYGLHLTADQLFFVGRCTKACRLAEATATTRYATASSRCNVPLMHMEAFARAFHCEVGTRMNPAHKCSFWA